MENFVRARPNARRTSFDMWRDDGGPGYHALQPEAITATTQFFPKGRCILGNEW